jgi:hypothetical protein
VRIAGFAHIDTTSYDSKPAVWGIGRNTPKYMKDMARKKKKKKKKKKKRGPPPREATGGRAQVGPAQKKKKKKKKNIRRTHRSIETLSAATLSAIASAAVPSSAIDASVAAGMDTVPEPGSFPPPSATLLSMIFFAQGEK